MIAKLIHWSLDNRFLVLVVTALLTAAGIYALARTPLDAIPDLSDDILFKDGTDIYWARSRVLEYLSQVIPRLPRAAKPELGPDATGVGWIYEYALVDRTGRHDLSQLRAIQDWFLKYELRLVPNVAEVASTGGVVQ